MPFRNAPTHGQRQEEHRRVPQEENEQSDQKRSEVKTSTDILALKQWQGDSQGYQLMVAICVGHRRRLPSAQQ